MVVSAIILTGKFICLNFFVLKKVLMNLRIHQHQKVYTLIGGNLLILECREHMYSKFYEKYGFKKLYDELDDNSLYTLYKKMK